MGLILFLVLKALSVGLYKPSYYTTYSNINDKST
jgi:hypothetical protein